MQLDQADPKGLVRESYAIEGISAGECRSIFIDWARIKLARIPVTITSSRLELS